MRHAGLCILLVAGAAACRDAGGPDVGARGSVDFAYGGAREGSFAARSDGRRLTRSGDLAAAFTAGDRTAPELRVMAVDAGRQPGEEDDAALSLTLPATSGPGELPIGEGCGTSLCASGSILLPDGVYLLTSGTVRVTEVGPDRVRGTFAATARDLLGGGEIAVLGGVLDVPVANGRPTFLYALR